MDLYTLTSEYGCCSSYNYQSSNKVYYDCGGDFTSTDDFCWSFYCPTPSDCNGVSTWAEILIIIAACVVGILLLSLLICCCVT